MIKLIKLPNLEVTEFDAENIKSLNPAIDEVNNQIRIGDDFFVADSLETVEESEQTEENEEIDEPENKDLSDELKPKRNKISSVKPVE